MTRITRARVFGIGEMSRATGVNIETIRYYERIGVMPKPDRTVGGNRQYDLEQLKRLSFIRHSRELGFSIEEIRALLGMVEKRDVTCGEVHEMTMRHLTAVQDKIKQLKSLEKALADMAAECVRGDVPDCPIIDTLFETVEAGRG